MNLPPPAAWRYRGEGPAFAVTLLVGLLLLAIAIPFTFGTVLLLVALGGLVGFLRVGLLLRKVRTKGQPATGRVAAIAERCRARLGIPADEVQFFVVDAPARNAFAVGLARPYAVAVFTGLLATVDDDELAFVLGHELGHVTFRHTRLLTLAGHLGQGGGVWSTVLRRLALLWWSRAAEHSADRAGLVAVGRVEPAVSALMKVALPPERQGDLDAQVRAAVARYRSEDVSFAASLRAMARTHPGLESRLDHLVDFAHSELGRGALG